MKSFIAKSVFVTLSLLLLSACHPDHVISQVAQNADKTSQKIDHAKFKDHAAAPTVVTKDGYYVDTTPVASEQSVSWLHEKINLKAKKMPLQFLVSKILRDTKVLIKYHPKVNQERLISLNYSGTIKGALETLAAQTDYAYKATEKSITWSSLVTKTFDVSFLPGSSTYLVGQTSSQNSNSIQNNSNNNNNISTMTGNLTDQQYSGLHAQLSLWNDVKNTIKDLTSKDGNFYVSEATTTVTVTDHPTNIAEVERYITSLNKEISKQVRLKVQVFEIDLDDAHAYGIDWNLVQHWLGTAISIKGGLFSNVASTAAPLSGTSGASPIGLIQAGPDGNNAMIQALSSQGKLSVVTEPTAVTMNDQMVEFRVTRDTSYLQSVSSTITGDHIITSALNPGVVTDGFVLYLLPKIHNNKVFLQISSTLSSLLSIDTASGNVNNENANRIQIPTLSEKRFNMRSKVPNGQTLVIAGFRQLRDESKQNKMWGSSALGGQGARSQNIETILLITPTIITGNS